jgi:Nodulin-like
VNFPHSRGTATGLPLAGYGLSAFLFSIISSIAFPDDTSKFLLMLAIVTFSLNTLSFFFIRLLPPSYSATLSQTRHGLIDSQELHKAKSHNPSYQNAIIEQSPCEGSSSKNDCDSAAEDPDVNMHETSSLLSRSSDSDSEEDGFGSGRLKGDEPDGTDIRGLALLAKSGFWELFFMFGLFSGIGLMNIK